MNHSWLTADWPAPHNIHAGTTTRMDGVSRWPFDSFNLATHVGDECGSVSRNRARLQGLLGLPCEPLWLKQCHGAEVAEMNTGRNTEADGAYTQTKHNVCAVLTADCIPLLLCSKDGAEIAALHIGWRGLIAGIITNALNRFHSETAGILAWLGPHISKQHYEVGLDVVSACSSVWSETAHFLSPGRTGHWYLDIGGLVRMELHKNGVNEIYKDTRCTYSSKALFYSHRREGRTGRMASLIWMD